jgi:predicted nucleotidyltransferase
MKFDMEKSSVESIVRALNQHQVQYLIVGGLAVVAHGHLRLTADVDLMLAVDAPNLQRAVKALESLAYTPRAPVAFAEFLDPAARRRWKAEKGMIVFSLYSPKHRATEIDLFLEPPIDFAGAASRAVQIDIAPGVPARICGLEDLIQLKTQSGRPSDLDDIAQLRRIHERGKP